MDESRFGFWNFSYDPFELLEKKIFVSLFFFLISASFFAKSDSSLISVSPFPLVCPSGNEAQFLKFRTNIYSFFLSLPLKNTYLAQY